MSRALPVQPLPPPAPPPVERRRWVAADVAYVGLRVAIALLFMLHGLQKLFGLFGGNAVPLASKLGVAGILELGGGLLLALGLFTRPVALVLAGEMVVAYLTAHLPRGIVPLQNGGEVALLYAVIFIFFALTPRARD